MSALPALSGRNEATRVHRNGVDHRKATAESRATMTAAQRRRSRRTAGFQARLLLFIMSGPGGPRSGGSLSIAARSAFHDPERAERDGQQDRHAAQGAPAARAECVVRRRVLE